MNSIDDLRFGDFDNDDRLPEVGDMISFCVVVRSCVEKESH